MHKQRNTSHFDKFILVRDLRFFLHCPNGAIFQSPGLAFCPKDDLSEGRSVRRTFCPKDDPSEGRSVRRTFCPKDVLSEGRSVRRTFCPKDVLSEGQTATQGIQNKVDQPQRGCTKRCITLLGHNLVFLFNNLVQLTFSAYTGRRMRRPDWTPAFYHPRKCVWQLHRHKRCQYRLNKNGITGDLNKQTIHPIQRFQPILHRLRANPSVRR